MNTPFQPMWLRCVDLNVCFYIDNPTSAGNWIAECLARGGYDFKVETV